MNVRRHLILWAALACAALWSACESSNPITRSRDIVFPDSNVSYRASLQPMFDLNCTYSGCHDDPSRAGGLSLTSWVNCNADAGNVIPYKPDNSKLCQVLERRVVHNGPLDTLTNHVRGIRQWVLEGAKNN